MITSHSVLGAFVVLTTALLIPSRSESQHVPREQAVVGTKVTVAPNPLYKTGMFGRFLFGTDYRSLWTIPVEIEVFDFGKYSGGLTPLKKGGFGQTTSLHVRDAEGVRHVFRSLDKDPARGLSDDLRYTFVGSVIRDQISSQHPYASLVVPDLLAVVGILHVSPSLYIMPDDPRLGEFQDEFAGLIGAIEERPNEAPDGGPGFAGADAIKSSSGMYDDLKKHGEERVDALAFLQARLMDVFLGDRDRHFEQWRWARIDNDDGSSSWLPIPKDRDQAFKISDGLMMAFLRIYQKQYVSFSEKYPNIEGASFNGRELDRRLLVGLGRSDWDSVAVDMQQRLTDEVIEGAVSHLPAEVFEASGDRLIGELKSRRDLLLEMANDYYLLLAKVVDFHSSDDPDRVTVDRLPNGRIHVTVETQEGRPYFERMFEPGETKEIRILTHGGDDSLTVSGFAAGPIKLRMIPGGGNDVMIDTSTRKGGHRTHWYDHRGNNVTDLGPYAVLSESEPSKKHPDELFRPPNPEDKKARSAQSFGRYAYPFGAASYSPDFGLSVTAGTYLLKYGFRKQPYHYRWTVAGTFTTSARSKVLTSLDFPDMGPNWELHLYGHWSRLETIRFNGFGNEVQIGGSGNENGDSPDAGNSFYDTKSTEVSLTAFMTKLLGEHHKIDFGPFFTYANDDTADDNFVGQNRDSLFGALDDLYLPGLGLSFTTDSRDNHGSAQKGVFINLQGRAVPEIFGVDSVGSFSRVFGQAATFLTASGAPFSPTLAVRVGGEAVWGDYPYYRAAFLGGNGNVRGYRENRFAGDAMAFGNIELRLKGFSVPIIFPWDIGLHGFFDAGRVWYDGDPDDATTIHTAFGGGVWFSVLRRAQTFRISLAKGEESTLLYFGAGFHF